TIIHKEAKLSAIANPLKDIQEAIKFIKHHGDRSQKNLHLKRQELSLHDLEPNYSEENFINKLKEVVDLKEKWEQLTEKRLRLEEEEEWLL
ncbi:V-type ATP synthase subunit I, partial [Enterococcus faecium]